MIQEVIKGKPYVFEYGFLYGELLWYAEKYDTSWYRSKESKAGENPYGSFMLNKKWTLEEEFNNHIFRFRQVILPVSLIFSVKITF